MTDKIEEVEVEILPNENCKDLVVTGEIIEDEKITMDEALEDADQKNSKRIAKDLQTLGDAYEEAQKTILKGKLEAKSILDEGKDIGITKGMIETYVAMKNYTDLNKFAIMGAINEKQ